MLTDKIQQCETSVFNTIREMHEIFRMESASVDTKKMLKKSLDGLMQAHFELTYARANYEKEVAEICKALEAKEEPISISERLALDMAKKNGCLYRYINGWWGSLDDGGAKVKNSAVDCLVANGVLVYTMFEKIDSRKIPITAKFVRDPDLGSYVSGIQS